ncbi:MAG TPA: DUF512 domain-containing protein [Soehngenia sp.]|nr:DUF512 domain-containing protein [Soehngenia sp.]HPP31343.1 DUF512 domain-containing protein [Soehngenia sp.]
MEIINNNLNNVIIEVKKGSLADELGIEPGDLLKKINNQPVKDIIDYKYLVADENITLEIIKQNGDIWEFEVEKDFSEDLGIFFSNSLIDKAKSCQNKCIFCFIDQLPLNLRETLYFKDDDSRLSFLQGNYITLTNMNEDEIDRIIKYRLSPINISVHTTNPDLRVRMLKNKRARNIMDVLKKLSDAKIELNCQIVLVPGINDAAELERTLNDLGKLYPSVNSIACVPVGLTKYRDHLDKINPFDNQSARDVLDIINKYQSIFKSRYGTRLVYASDEFYCLSGIDLPSYESYEDFPQYENGVGMLRSFLTEVTENISKLDSINYIKAKRVAFATGVSAYPYMKSISELISKKIDKLEIEVVKIINDFFGENITVSGLITGKDLIKNLSKEEYKNIDYLLIPENMLRKNDDLFLDDYRITDVKNILGFDVIPIEISGKKLIDFFRKECSNE